MHTNFPLVRVSLQGGLLLMGLVISNLALAEDPPASVRSASAKAFSAVKTVDEAELKLITGKADVSQSVTASNTSNVSNNSVSGQSTTGQLNFSSGAFQDLHGLALVNANTGNNVSINSSLNVTIALQR